MFFKLPCPQPKVFPTDTTTCTELSYQFLTNTTSELFIFEITENLQHPQPYTSYQFVLQAENKVGAVNSSESEVVTTITSGK